MVRTRSQNSQLGDEDDEHTITPQEPTLRRTAQIRFTDQSPSTSAGQTQQEPSLRARLPSPTRSTRSQRSTASRAARMKQAEYEAAERIAAIKLRQLELEADLVQKKLEADLATIQDDDRMSTQGPEEAIHSRLRMDDWLRNADHIRGEPPSDRLPARETRTPLAAATAVRHNTNIAEPRPERNHDDRRARSPTPSRSRNRSIEALVENFERLSRYRPPPRSSTELPTFSGSENEWLPFKASMRDSTRLHKFSPIENMQRLRNALKGEARDAVASLLYTACDPTEIMEALEQSFGRPEALIDKALDEIKLLPRLGPTTTELNVFTVKVRNIVATITNVEGLDGCLQNRMLTRDIVDKLPPDLRRSFAKYASENRRPGEPHIVILSRFLNHEATIGLEFTYSKPATPATSTRKELDPKSKGTFHRTNKVREASVFTAVEMEQCLCCGGDHEPPQCKNLKEMTVNARWDWAKSNKICFKCLAKKHQRATCKAKRCSIDGCIHSHHFLLHQRSPENSNEPLQDSSAEVVASTATDLDMGYKVMLKVCPIVVSNSDGFEIQTYALLDEGSTITLIEEDLADELNLKGPAHAVTIHGVNSTQRERTSRIIRLKLRGKNSKSSHVVRARTIRNIQLLNQAVPKQLLQYPHLRTLEPSSVCYEQARPRLLIGSDNWELIVSKQLLTGRRNEPAASRTELGWVIHGSAPHVTLSRDEDQVLHIRTGNVERAKENQRIPTGLNVANDTTRLNLEPIKEDRLFLRETEDAWPSEDPTLDDNTEEIVTHVTVATNYASTLPDITRFSTYEKLIRTTARILAFSDICRKRSTSLEVRHLKQAENLWQRAAQQESFAEDLNRLSAGQAIQRSSRLAKLDPILEHGLLRVRSRIDAARVPDSTKRPIILDGRHPFTRLLLAREHSAAGHANNERVVNDVRQKYWVTNLRPTVKKVLQDCLLCCVRRSTPNIPATGNLPTARLDPFHRPFTNCGVDFFGPMLVAVGRRREKRWGAFFTYLTTRAVHLELVASFSTESAIMAIRRMAARRSWPATMYSDNATNFRGADAELKKAYTEWEPALRDLGLYHRMQWHFIPPRAPNQGGAWERLVRSVKVALNASLREKVPKEEVLLTLLSEAEHSINVRPLTHVSVDPADPEALTPNHFLLASSTGLPHTGPCEPADRRTWRAMQALADSFWRRWVHEYLPTLVPRGQPASTQRQLREGDLVVIVDPTLPRNVWPRGIIEHVHPGPDGEVRSATVRTRAGVFHRPTRKLAVLTRIEEGATRELR